MTLTQHNLTLIWALCVKFHELRFLCCDIFLSLRTNTENASFQHNEHRWYQFKRFVWKFS